MAGTAPSDILNYCICGERPSVGRARSINFVASGYPTIVSSVATGHRPTAGTCLPWVLPILPHRHQRRHQTCFDLEYGSIGFGIADVPKLIGCQVCQCLASRAGALPRPQGSNHCGYGVRPGSRHLFFRCADTGVRFDLSHFQSPMVAVCEWKPDTRAFGCCSAQREQPGKRRQPAAKSTLNLSAEMLFCGGSPNLGDSLCASGCSVVLK